ncbi:hypothetical protein [Stenotrophomonas sp.]|uniref:hypothetical protein n=1 Tax=Stenotrophomonas sp. TaxID=69392 RepID=UPI0028AFF502|nr:hypothetical protein [Stenotrophomonas sp.]
MGANRWLAHDLKKRRALPGVFFGQARQSTAEAFAFALALVESSLLDCCSQRAVEQARLYRELPCSTAACRPAKRWYGNTSTFIDQAVGSTIARSNSPMELVANLQAAFHGEIPGNALSEDALSFTVEYFSPRATYLSDFFSLFPQDAMPSPDAMWDKQEQVYAIIDSRLQSWRNGEPIRPSDHPQCRSTRTCQTGYAAGH